MAKIDRSYTIKYSKGGVTQYADFKYSENKLIHHTFSPSWVKVDEVPDISELNDIDEILEVIKEFAYGNRAAIYLLNHAPPFMENRELEKAFVKDSEVRLREFYKAELSKYYTRFLKPIILKNNWVLIKSGIGYDILVKSYSVDKYDEPCEPYLDNVRQCPELYEFEYLCQEILYSLRLLENKKPLKEEYSSGSLWCSHRMFQYLND